ncbi:MAG: hypothetical protein IKZ87_08430 [Actinomycetaceae bacterium]|nr:hypothetical protein [Actinomycetaceae bacterium]
MEKLIHDRERLTRLAVAALMPVALTWFACILIFSFIYLLTASAPALEDATWADTLHLGTSLWLVSVGATIRIGVARISLIPLTLTVLTWWLSVRSAQRAFIATWEDVAIYTAVTTLFAGLLGFIDYEGTFLIGALVGAALLGFTASLVAWWSCAPVPLSWWKYVQRGWQWARPVLIAAFACATAAFLIALIVSFKRVGAIYEAYLAHWVGNAGITFAQLLYLPLFIVWALSFIVGVPIHVGEGTSFSPFSTSSAPLPGIPFFGVIPSTHFLLYGLPLVLVCAGVASAWWVTRSRDKADSALIVLNNNSEVTVAEVDAQTGTVTASEMLVETTAPLTFRQRAIDAGMGLAIVFIVLACAGALSSGALGSGRMYEIGLNAPLFALFATLELALGVFAFLAISSKK